MKLFDQTFKIKLNNNNDNRGYFIEIFKLNQINFKSKISQVSHSFIKKKINIAFFIQIVVKYCIFSIVFFILLKIP